MAGAPVDPTTPPPSDRAGRQPGRRHARTRFGIAVAAVAAVALVGCGTESSEPSDKNWGNNSQQSEQGNGNEKQDSGNGGSNKGQGKDEKKGGTVVRGGDEDEADADTKAKAEEVVADYLDAENEGIQKGDFSGAKALVEDCSICEENWANNEKVFEDGGKIEGALFTEPEVSAGQTNDGEVFVDVATTVSAYKVIDGSGTVTERDGAEKLSYQFSVAKTDGEWKIVSGRLVQ